MSVFWLLWILLALLLGGFAVWMFLLQYRQKQAWSAFAKKHGFRYTSKGPVNSPEMAGQIDGRAVAFFACEHMREEERTSRKLTAIEIEVHSDMPMLGAIASGGMVAVIQHLEGLTEELTLKYKKWNALGARILTDNKAAMQAYCTEDRLKALLSLMRIDNAWVAMAFRKGDIVLRVDMPDPLECEEKLSRMLKILVKAAKTLELNDGEREVLQSAKATKAKSKKIDVDAELETGLELDED